MHNADDAHPREDRRIARAIQEAEKETSGEIRVILAGSQPQDAAAEAQREFHRLEMRRTPMRNAVLLYFSPRPNRLTIVADEGIRLRCGQEFIDAVNRETTPLIEASRLEEAILTAIRAAGGEMARQFPKNTVDRNDLPNAVIRT